MKPSDFLSREDMAYFTKRSDAWGLWMIVSNWLVIAAAFVLAAYAPNPLTLLLAVALLGGRQLGLAILMHDAGHKTLFKSPTLNRVLGQWLCASPVLADCEAYGASHRIHHRTAGTQDDPDLPNYQSYPVSKARFSRKLRRDITGQTGIKLLLGTLTGRGKTITQRDGEQNSALSQGLLVNGLLFAVLWLAGYPALYLLWVLAYLTVYPLFARIRQVAEHGAVADLYDRDPRLHTRTTLVRWYERAFLSPNYVNFHLEHHLMPSVPCYRLPRLHKHLAAQGYYDEHPAALARGYRAVLKCAVA